MSARSELLTGCVVSNKTASTRDRLERGLQVRADADGKILLESVLTHSKLTLALPHLRDFITFCYSGVYSWVLMLIRKFDQREHKPAMVFENL